MAAPAGDSNTARPLVVYDGNCSICLRWINYWRTLTGNSLNYAPYQAVAGEYPDIPLAEFQQALQYIDADGKRFSGAEATFRIFRNKPPHCLLFWLYRRLPGFAPLSEAAYRFFSGHRTVLEVITTLFWGRQLRPDHYVLTSWIFHRCLGVILFSAFVSLTVQVQGLIGSNGILPVTRYLDTAHSTLGIAAWYRIPTLFWFDSSDLALLVACFAGMVLSVLVILNRYTSACLFLCFILYLSLFYAGQVFLGFQWDLLLIETTFLAAFLGSGSLPIVWLFRWLLFRFMFLGGVVKITSGDPVWDNLTALYYHFETQPLPTVLAWYAHHLPDVALRCAVLGTFIIELLLPFFIFLPRNFRHVAAAGIILLQIAILLTGNYNFFNLLTLSLCLLLFDDHAIARVIPAKVASASGKATKLRFPTLALTTVLAITLVSTGTGQVLGVMTVTDRTRPGFLNRAIEPFRIVNSYGPFAVMTRTRHEIKIEGSLDGENWQEYEFKYNPGDTDRLMFWCIPHQPRLDWQMWFAALSPPERNPWFGNLLLRLLQNESSVTTLFNRLPFDDNGPAMVRALYYRYAFTSPVEQRETGHWWKKTLIGTYYPAIRIRIDVDE